MRKIKYSNKLETKLFGFLALAVIIATVSAIIIGFNKVGKFEPMMILWIAMIVIVSLLFIVIVRYKVVFDMENRIVIFTPYFKKTKKYTFDEIKMVFDSNFLPAQYQASLGSITMMKFYTLDNELLFKFSNNQFEAKAKESTNTLIDVFGSDINKRIIALSEEIKKLDCFVEVKAYEPKEKMIFAYGRVES